LRSVAFTERVIVSTNAGRLPKNPAGVAIELATTSHKLTA